MLKKFQHDSDIANISNFDYGLWMNLPSPVPPVQG
jgi:hypothetical protein